MPGGNPLVVAPRDDTTALIGVSIAESATPATASTVSRCPTPA